jgi:hypothetical protein
LSGRDEIEGSIRKPGLLRLCLHIADIETGAQRLCALEHWGGHIEARDDAAFLGEAAGERTCAGTEIEQTCARGDDPISISRTKKRSGKPARCFA